MGCFHVTSNQSEAPESKGTYTREGLRDGIIEDWELREHSDIRDIQLRWCS